MMLRHHLGAMLKKGIIDFVIAVMAAVTYLHYNPNTFDISLFKLTVTLNPIIYGVLIVILIWVSINVTNCSDGVDGLCGTLSAITLSSAYVLFMIFDIERFHSCHTILIMVVVFLVICGLTHHLASCLWAMQAQGQ